MGVGLVLGEGVNKKGRPGYERILIKALGQQKGGAFRLRATPTEATGLCLFVSGGGWRFRSTPSVPTVPPGFRTSEGPMCCRERGACQPTKDSVAPESKRTQENSRGWDAKGGQPRRGGHLGMGSPISTGRGGPGNTGEAAGPAQGRPASRPLHKPGNLM